MFFRNHWLHAAWLKDGRELQGFCLSLSSGSIQGIYHCLPKKIVHRFEDYLGNALTHDPKNAKTILAAGSIIQDSLFLVPTLCIKGTPQWDQKIKCTVTHLVLSYHTGTSVTFIRCRTTLTWMWRWSNTVWLLCTRRTLPSYGISLHLNLRRHVNIGRRGDMFEEDLSMCFATVEIIDDIDVVWAEGCLMVNSTACLAALACASLGRQSMWLRSLALGWEKMHLQDVDFFTHDLSLQLAWINLEAWSEHFIWIHLNGSFPTIWVLFGLVFPCFCCLSHESALVFAHGMLQLPLAVRS